MIWKKIGNIKGKDGKPGANGESIVGPAGRDGRDSGTVHRVLKAGYPDSQLGVNGDWAFNIAWEIFFKENNKWIFFRSFETSGTRGGGGGGGLSTVTNAIGITIDGGGAVISTGVKGYVHVPYDCTINSVTLLADVSGSIVIDVWKDTYANYPPTVADTITAAAKPTITTATKSQDTTLTGWTTTVTAGDTIGFNVDSASTVTRVHLSLKVTQTG